MAGNRKRKKQLSRSTIYRRKDMITRLVVDVGINYLPTLGMEKAAEFMRENHVPEKVSLRVLTSPRLRRVY